MKLEMRVWDMKVHLELEDDHTEDQLSILTTVRDLLDTLSRFEKVNVNITQVENPHIIVVEGQAEEHQEI